MASLAQLPELVGFFSYSREDDEAFRGSLSALRDAIQRDLSAQLGRSSRNFRLWQDQEAIAPGQMWESQIAEAVKEAAFFIPIVTPRAVVSKYCKFEFDSFLVRERKLGREDLVFPIHYILVPALLDEAEWRSDPVLSTVAKRQYVDWRSYRWVSVDTPAFAQAIDQFCGKIAETLRQRWISPEERSQFETGAIKRGEDEERLPQEAEAKRQTDDREKLSTETLAKKWGKRRATKREVASKEGGAMAGKLPEGAIAVDWDPMTARYTAMRDTTAPISPLPAREKEKSHSLTNLEPLTAAQERALKSGAAFKEGGDCPEMVVVPAGRFLMGSPQGQGDDNEHPQHEVTIARFAVAKFALTFDEWDACATDRGCRPNKSDQKWGRGRRPVINVDWDDAQAYVRWLSKITGKPYRLLSEAEWEYAARAGTETKYPWGAEITLNGKQMANCTDSSGQWEGKQTAPVGSFPANAFGLCDMIGNVWEWTEDCWNTSYRGAPADGSTWASGDCSLRVSRGGAWDSKPADLRSAVRAGGLAVSRGNTRGFRVARTLGA